VLEKLHGQSSVRFAVDCDSRRAWNRTNALRSGAQVEWDSRGAARWSWRVRRALPLLGENASAARPTTVCENYCCHLPPALFLAAGVPVHVRARPRVGAPALRCTPTPYDG